LYVAAAFDRTAEILRARGSANRACKAIFSGN
jgi:hypothetical protein